MRNKDKKEEKSVYDKECLIKNGSKKCQERKINLKKSDIKIDLNENKI